MISIRVHPGNALTTLEGKSRIRPHGYLPLAKLLYGANVFEISNIQKMKLKPAAKANRNVTMLPWVGNRRMEFSVCTVGLQPVMQVKLIQIRTHQFFTQRMCLSGNPFQPVLVMQSAEDPSSA